MTSAPSLWASHAPSYSTPATPEFSPSASSKASAAGIADIPSRSSIPGNFSILPAAASTHTPIPSGAASGDSCPIASPMISSSPSSAACFGRKFAAPTSPTGELYKDEMMFKGWRWVCPACKKEVRTIYCPFAAPSLFEWLGFEPAKADADRFHKPPTTFACWSCHRIDGTSLTTSGGWNQVISHCTTGLLYGHEVPKPHWYRPKRKTPAPAASSPNPPSNAKPSTWRSRNGWTTEQIARDLLIPKQAVELHIQRTCKQDASKTAANYPPNSAGNTKPKRPRKTPGRGSEKDEQVLPCFCRTEPKEIPKGSAKALERRPGKSEDFLRTQLATSRESPLGTQICNPIKEA